jgi:hypothetical protein
MSSGSLKRNNSPSLNPGSTKRSFTPICASGSTAGKNNEPTTKIIRVDIDAASERGETHDPEITDYAPEHDDDIVESLATRWQASDELTALLDVCFSKPLSGYDKRQLARSCPRPDVDKMLTMCIHQH